MEGWVDLGTLTGRKPNPGRLGRKYNAIAAVFTAWYRIPVVKLHHSIICYVVRNSCPLPKIHVQLWSPWCRPPQIAAARNAHALKTTLTRSVDDDFYRNMWAYFSATKDVTCRSEVSSWPRSWLSESLALRSSISVVLSSTISFISSNWRRKSVVCSRWSS